MEDINSVKNVLLAGAICGGIFTFILFETIKMFIGV